MVIEGKRMSLSQLGNKVELPQKPEEATLEIIPIKEPSIRKAVVRFSVPEFTSLCPVTGQPDFARIYIDFVPKLFLIESKSLKLFMGSFRNHGAFHEEVTCYIGHRLWNALNPKWIRVVGIWYPRGGIPIDIKWEDGKLPNGISPLPLKLPTFEGR